MPERAVAPDTFRQDLVDQGVAILTEDLWKTYEMGGGKAARPARNRSRIRKANMSPSWGLQARANPRS